LLLYLALQDIALIKADVLFAPIDGRIRAFSGSAAATALRRRLPPEMRDKYFQEIEEEVIALPPMRDGEASLMSLDADYGLPWKSLALGCALPHPVDGLQFSTSYFFESLRQSLAKAIQLVTVEPELSSMAMTVMANSYRLPTQSAVRAMLQAINASSDMPLTLTWAFREPDAFHGCEEACRQAGINFRSTR